MSTELLKKDLAKNHCKLCSGSGEVKQIPPAGYKSVPRCKANKLILNELSAAPCPCRKRIVQGDASKAFYQDRII